MKKHLICSVSILVLSSLASGVQFTRQSPGPFTTPGNLGFVTVFHGTPGGLGDVHTYEERSGSERGAPPRLSGIRLLPIDFVGRSELDRFMPDRPRYHADIPGASRLSLPRDGGSLYQFMREDEPGYFTFAFLLLRAEEPPAVLLETPGIGPLGLDNPFVDRIAVSDDSVLTPTIERVLGSIMNFYVEGRKAGAFRELSARHFVISLIGLSLFYYAGGKSSATVFDVEDVAAPENVSWRGQEIEKLVLGGVLAD